MKLDDAAKALKKREPIFHREAFGRTRADFEKMMDEHFWEVGASGAIYTKEHVLEILEERYSQPYTEDWQVKDFQCTQLAETVYLVTYTLIQNKIRVTRRSTLWKHHGNNDWKIIYHQGTVVERE